MVAALGELDLNDPEAVEADRRELAALLGALGCSDAREPAWQPKILEDLDGVEPDGTGGYRAKCPACGGVARLTRDEGLTCPACSPEGIDVRLLADNAATASAGAAAAGSDGIVPLGERDPATGRRVLSPTRTPPTAEAYVREFQTHAEGRTLHSYAGELWAWEGNCYRPIEDESLRARLQPWLHDALRCVKNRKTGEAELVPFESNPGTVKAALESLRTHVHIPASMTPPAWLGEADGKPDPGELLACRTANLHIPTGRVLPATPALFNTNALDFDFDAFAPEPDQWLAFMRQLWGDDAESIQLLQDWAGYCLTGDTSQQKMLLLVGPRRSGKGTIGRVLTRLIGPANVVGPTATSLAGTFGLQPLIGKSLAVVSDARFAGENVGTLVERLLCISGEDTVTIDRKHRAALTMRLPTRFMFLTNELPRLAESSGALAGRFMVLRLTETFYGREDPTLTDRLVTELPGILLWALEGWHRLHRRGRFVQPQSSQDAVQDMEDLNSPAGAFVRECCTVGPGYQVRVDDLYAAWQAWCDRDGRRSATTRQTFGRDLHSVVPGIKRRKGTGLVPFYEGIGLKDT